MTKLILIAVAGGAGSLLRFGLSGWVQKASDSPFPLGTLSVNVLGCLMIGVLTALFTGPYLLRDEIRFAILVGLLGGFTTFSTFAWETTALMNDGQWARAGMNILLSNILGLGAAWLGYRIGQSCFGV